MAYLANDYIDDEQKKQQQAPAQSAQSPIMSSSGSLSGGAPSSANGPMVRPTVQNNSGFTDLRKYLSANQDQAQDYANQFANRIQQTGSSAQNAINNAKDSYNSTLQQNAVAPDDALIQRANSNPASFVQNADDLAKFNKMRDNNVTDPGTFESQSNYGDLTTQAQKAANNANLVKTESGRKSLIQESNPSLGKGKTSMNQLLLGANPQAWQTIASAANPYKDLSTYLTGATTESDAARDKFLSDAAAAQAQVNSQFIQPQTTNLQNMENTLNTNRQNIQQNEAANNSTIDALTSYLRANGPSLTTTQMRQLGMDPNTFRDTTYGASAPDIQNHIMDYLLERAYPNAQQRAGIKASDIGLNEATQRMTNLVLNNQPYDPNAVRYALYPDHGANLMPEGYNDAVNYENNAIKENVDSRLRDVLNGATKSSGNYTNADAAGLDAIARVQALEQLLNTGSNFFNPDELAARGQYQYSNLPLFQKIGYGGNQNPFNNQGTHI